MGLFDKKYCDVCGEKIGLLGNRKLEDGNLCKECSAKLSPWFSDRRHSSLAEIKDQLAYRAENQAAVAAFHTTRTLGSANTKILLDEDARKFMVTSARNLAEANPDVLDYSQVTGCQVRVEETQTEQEHEDKDGNMVSYNPPRYDTDYDFHVTIHVNTPWFDEITFQVNRDRIERKVGPEYRQAEQDANEIREILTSVREETREQAAAAAAPKKPVTCPLCGAVTTPDASGCCEYCGGPVAG